MSSSSRSEFVNRFGRWHGWRAWRAWLRAHQAPRGTLVPVPLPGLPRPLLLRAGTTDPHVLEQIFVREELAFDVPAAPTFVVDAGANIGLSSIWLATRFPQARIVALEIEPENFALLARNVAAHPRVSAWQCGLWSRATTLEVVNPADEAWAFYARSPAPGAAGGVPAVSVADVLAREGVERVGLLKIDIEGGEREVFAEGAEAWIDRVDQVAVELHEQWFPGCSAPFEALVAGRPFARTQLGEYTVLTRAPLAARAG
ncbi:MAG TPA: FkbM family methyltransferase [Gemmatirosa sp.]|nr:FkbM family methyltransferase [Gemmatirosa sp.]